MKPRKAGRSKKSPPKAILNSNTVVFDQAKEVRAIARERLGIVKAAKVMLPKTERKKPKHKKKIEGNE
ncbi:MAG: hypothetical protein ABL967_00660 [Bryobacteraceae bacterium]